jgi:hypothetical protein
MPWLSHRRCSLLRVFPAAFCVHFYPLQLRKAQTPIGTPAINKKSKSICKQQHQGDFLMRVQKNVLRKEHDKVHKNATQPKVRL